MCVWVYSLWPDVNLILLFSTFHANRLKLCTGKWIHHHSGTTAVLLSLAPARRATTFSGKKQLADSVLFWGKKKTLIQLLHTHVLLTYSRCEFSQIRYWIWTFRLKTSVNTEIFFCSYRRVGSWLGSSSRQGLSRWVWHVKQAPGWWWQHAAQLTSRPTWTMIVCLN